jgi:hypothetical protein
MRRVLAKEIFKIAQTVFDVLNKTKVEYLLYGSLAVNLLTQDDKSKVNDVDIIVSEGNFPKLMVLLSDPKLELDPKRTAHNIHANHLRIKGYDNKPFDLSFDSYEHYFSDREIDIKSYTEKSINDTKVKTINREDPLKVYESVSRKNGVIQSAHKDKINKLKKL